MAETKENASGMTLKKKAMLGAVVVFFLLIGWQLVGLLGLDGGGDKAAVPSVVPAMANKSSSVKVTPAVSTVAIPSASSPAATVTTPADTHLEKFQTVREEKYIQSLNDLEALKIQREIAEMNQAIATAKFATATAEKNRLDLALKSMPVPVAAATYANGLVAPTAQGAPVTGNDTSDSDKAPSSVRTTNDYTVISIFMQGDKWSAVLGYQGKLFNVSVGDVLPTDGSTVSSINDGAVVLQRNGKSKQLSMLSSI